MNTKRQLFTTKHFILLLFFICLSTSTSRKLQEDSQNHGPTDWSLVIVNCKNGVYTSFGAKCTQCKAGYRLDSQRRSCVQNVWYCAEYSRQNQSQCSLCVSEYVLSNNFCYKTVGLCERFNYVTNECEKCIARYFMQNNECITVPCQSGQYRNQQGYCVKGNIAGCQQYLSPSGDCEICQLNYWKDPTTRQCITQPVCPSNNSQYKYVIEFNQCKKVQNVCQYWMGEVCGACRLPYYLLNGVCIKIPGF